MGKTKQKKMLLSDEQSDHLFSKLKDRFQNNVFRHPSLQWEEVLARLNASPTKLWSLSEMERTGGEPDVVLRNEETVEITFADCCKETPIGRRGLCYDREGLESRKEHRPENNAVDMAIEMGVQLLSEEEYRFLQTLGEFDLKTSSWIHTPAAIRKLGGALFCDRRYGQVFTYHNGAQSYYGSRAFRALIKV